MGDSEKTDRQLVWEQVAREHPEFREIHDPANNHHAVREIVLGGSLAWAGVHSRFKPGPGKRVMDIGANTGIFSTFCAVKGCDFVLAFEPFYKPYQLFSRMLGDTSLYWHVSLLPHAVWIFDGPEVKYVGNHSKLEGCDAFNGGVPADGVTENFDHALNVPCVTLETALGYREWDCVKMDIEGAECEVLITTPVERLKQIKFLYVEFHPWTSQLLYEKAALQLLKAFNVEGVGSDRGRYEAAYCTRKP